MSHWLRSMACCCGTCGLGEGMEMEFWLIVATVDGDSGLALAAATTVTHGLNICPLCAHLLQKEGKMREAQSPLDPTQERKPLQQNANDTVPPEMGHMEIAKKAGEDVPVPELGLERQNEREKLLLRERIGRS